MLSPKIGLRSRRVPYSRTRSNFLRLIAVLFLLFGLIPQAPVSADTYAPTTPTAFVAGSSSAPAATTPAATTPAATTPVATTPVVTTPAATTPAVTTPAATTPAVTTPAATTPVVTTPAATTPVATPTTAPSGTVNPAAAPILQITKSASVVTVASGQSFTYSFVYRCASITQDCLGTTLSDILPPELSGLAVDVSLAATTPDIASFSYTQATRTALFTFVSPLPAGSTGTVAINVKFPNYTTANGTVAVNTATLSATNATTVISNPVSVTATSGSNWVVTKSAPSITAVDVNTTYTVQMCPPATGALSLTNATMVDTFPIGATFVSATGAPVPVYTAPNTVTWTITGATPITTCQSRNITLIYPTPTFTVGQSVTNNVTATGQPFGQPGIVGVGSGSRTHTLTNPTATASTTKTVNNSTIAINGSSFYALTAKNTGSVPLANFVLEDDLLPTQITLTSLTTGINSSGAAVPVNISYKTNSSAGYITTGLSNPYAGNTNATITIASLHVAGLPAADYLTGIRWDYGTVPIGFNSSSTAPRINFSLLSPDPTGTAVANSAVVPNCSRVTSTTTLTPLPATSCVNFTVIAPTSNPSPAKTVLTATPPGGFLPGAQVTYRLRVRNANTASATFDNPILMDLLPTAVDLVTTPAPGYTWTNGAAALAVPGATTPDVFENLPNYGGTGRTLLRWRWTALSMPINTEMYVDYTVQIKAGTPPGTINNIEALTSNVGLNNCATTDVNDLDGDGSAIDKRCETGNIGISVGSVATLASQKLVKGQLDGGFSLAGLTIPGGTADYKLTVSNTGNIPIKNIEVIDILPYIGDTGVIDPQARLTEWRPNLMGVVTAPAGITVYYSTQANPCRPELVPGGPAGCTAASWTTTLPADPTTVQSVKFDFGAIILNPSQGITLGWPMRAPVGTLPGKLAWNSFGYVGTRTDNNQTLLPSEPIKVNIQVQASAAASYGDYVWLDTNHNGIQEAGELGLNGVKVDLYQPGADGLAGTGDDVFVATILTANDVSSNPGYYLFPGLPPGQYFAKFTLPAGYTFTLKNQGGDPTKDSDADLITGLTAITTLAAGQNDLTWDAGLWLPPASLGDYVWIDTNHNGIQEAGEVGLNGVKVDLYKPGADGLAGTGDDMFVATTTTTNDVSSNPGYYLFPNLPTAQYFVKFTLPTGYTFTLKNQGGDPTKDSDADLITGLTVITTLAVGQNDLTWDAGLWLTPGLASLGDYVWIDTNHNGIQEAGELGLNGVKVDLYQPGTDGLAGTIDDVFVSTTLTANDVSSNPGYYLFPGLSAGQYFVKFTLPAGYTFTLKNQGGDPTKDSDADTTTGLTAITTLAAGQNDLTWDAGLWLPPASLGDYVWIDTNHNGIQEAGEVGINGVKVDLYQPGADGLAGTPDDVFVATINTANDVSSNPGYYLFPGLSAGQYFVKFTLPTGYTFTLKNQGGDPTKDSDADTTTGMTIITTLAVGQNDLTWDAGLWLPPALASLGDRVWLDTNHNGIQDGGETGVNGVTVTLYDATTNIQVGASTSTNGSGIYGFTNLNPGSYYVVFTPPAGYVVTLQTQGSDTTVDSNPDPNPGATYGRTATVTLVAGQNDPTIDAGLWQPASLGDYVWIDTNHNGIQEAGEVGLNGVKVDLYKPGADGLAGTGDDVFVATTSTANDVSSNPGYYLFPNLTPGQYFVKFTLPTGYNFTLKNQGGDPTKDSDADTTTGLTVITTLAAGQNDLTWDAGLWLPPVLASLGDYVWIDSNHNGIQEAGEIGINGVKVDLYQPGLDNLAGTGDDVFVATINTANDVSSNPGYYLFSGLSAGQYFVKFTLPASYNFTLKNQGSDPTKDSDADTTTGLTVITTLAAGQNDLTWDAGLWLPPTPTTPVVTTPVVTTPVVTTPAVTTPAVTTPAVTTPAVTTPVVTTPVVTTPAVTTPAVTTPVITTPVVTTPAVTTVAPPATTPAVTTPAVTTPAVTTPANGTTPPVTTPGGVTTTPAITTTPANGVPVTPPVTNPSGTTPAITTPAVIVVAPTTPAEGGTTPTPTPAVGDGTTPTPTPSAGAGTTPTPSAGAGTTPTPSAGSGTTPTPSAGAGTTPTPSAGAGTTPTPTQVAGGTPGAGIPSTVNKNEPYLLKTVDSETAVAGQLVRYTISVTNPAGLPVDKVTVTDNVPNMLEVKDGTTSQGAVKINGQIVIVEIGTIASGGSVTIVVTTKARDGINGKVVNTATMVGEKGGVVINLSGNTTAVASLVAFPNVPNTGFGSWEAGLLNLLKPLSEREGSSTIQQGVSDFEMLGKSISAARIERSGQADSAELKPGSGPIVPVRLRIPALGIDADIEEVGLRKGAMDVPGNIWNAGWLNSGPRPGDVGNAVLDGHKDSVHGTAIFWELGKLKAGDKIYVSDQYGYELTFEVSEVQSYANQDVPLARLFGGSAERQLNLVTCDGTFVREQLTYDRRVIVYTHLISSN